MLIRRRTALTWGRMIVVRKTVPRAGCSLILGPADMWIDNLRDDLRHHGVAKAVARAGYKLANRIGHLDMFRLVELTEASINPESLAHDSPYACRFVEGDERYALSRQFGEVLTRRYVETAVCKGDDCFAVFDGSTCAAFGWYSRRPTVIRDTLVLHFDSDWTYMYHGYTRPEYRGQRLHALGITRAMKVFAERGLEGMISIAEATNYHTHRSSYRMGFVDRGIIWRVGFRNLSRIGQTRSCDAYGIRVESDPRVLKGSER